MNAADFVLCVTAAILFGICAVDLVFDQKAYVPKGVLSVDQLSAFDHIFVHSIQPAQVYYRAVLLSPVVTYLIPAAMASQVICILHKLKTNPTVQSMLLLALFAIGAPYFELVVKPAEGIVATTSIPEHAGIFLEAVATVRQGHLILTALLAATLLLVVSEQHKTAADPPALQIVRKFLTAQEEQNLEQMCGMVSEDIVYINEPHEANRHIRGLTMFREAFAGSPCIWATEARLEVLRESCTGNVVHVERRDQFLIQGQWLEIPILGYLVVNKQGKISKWVDYWCYKKYKAQTTAKFGPEFSLFKATKA